MTNSTLEKLKKLKEKKELLDARIAKVEALHKTRERKLDTRRKILLGSYYLDKARKENNFDEVKKIMDKYLTRDSDKALFNFKPINKDNTIKAKKENATSKPS